ncbi:MAG: 3-hydroxyacyl-ACP dehydratase [Bacteroidota bacterium]
MLRNNFFAIVGHEFAPGTVKATITLDKNHPIFKGHFPGQPIVPGVCMMQIVKEIMELQQARPLAIKGVDNMKFLSVVNPGVNSTLEIDIRFKESPEGIEVQGALLAGDITFFKIKAILH